METNTPKNIYVDDEVAKLKARLHLLDKDILKVQTNINMLSERVSTISKALVIMTDSIKGINNALTIITGGEEYNGLCKRYIKYLLSSYSFVLHCNCR